MSKRQYVKQFLEANPEIWLKLQEASCNNAEIARIITRQYNTENPNDPMKQSTCGHYVRMSKGMPIYVEPKEEEIQPITFNRSTKPNIYRNIPATWSMDGNPYDSALEVITSLILKQHISDLSNWLTHEHLLHHKELGDNINVDWINFNEKKILDVWGIKDDFDYNIKCEFKDKCFTKYEKYGWKVRVLDYRETGGKANINEVEDKILRLLKNE